VYAVVGLSIAILYLAMRFAPFGADLAINRGDSVLSSASIRRTAVGSAVTGGVAGAIAGMGYHLSGALAGVIAIAVAAGGVTVYCAAALQARRRYLPSLALLHSVNYLLLALAIITAATGATSVVVIVGSLSAGMLAVMVVAALKLRGLLRLAPNHDAVDAASSLVALVAITGSAELLAQLDRLLTPATLSLGDLAQLSVLLALVGPPFRLLEMAVAYAMLPELRAATTRVGRRRALQRSAVIALPVCMLATLLLWLFVTPVSHWLVGPTFTLPLGVTLAAVAAGLVRVAHGYAGAAATALIPNERLSQLAALGMISAGVGIAGAVIGSRWGLQGVICGSMTGWIFRTVVYASMVRQMLDTHTDAT